MANLINEEEIPKIILKVLEEDMNKSLEIITTKVIKELENTVRANVAARMIAMTQSDYSLKYDRNELCIRVKMETSNG